MFQHDSFQKQTVRRYSNRRFSEAPDLKANVDSSGVNDHTKRSILALLGYEGGEVEELIECSDNLTSFCNSYKLLGISIENLFLYPIDRAAISSVERYAIDEFRHVEANCERNISVERYILETANNFSGNPRSYICPLSYGMARATILSLLIELSSSERVEPGLPLLLPFNFGCKNGNFTRQINLELVICHPARILEWIDSLKGSMSLSPQQEKVEGILLLVGKFEGSSDYDYESWVVNVPNGEFLSSISPTDLKYWERYTGPDSVKEWRKHLDILLPMLAPIVTLYYIWVTYGAYIVVCCVDSKIIKATVLHDEIVVQEIKSNIVLCTTKIQEFCNKYTPLEADLVLVDGRNWLEVKPFSYSSATFIIFTKFSIHTFDPGILNIRITDDIELAMHTHTGTPTTYYLIAMLGREQLGGLVMGEIGTDAFVNFDKMAKYSDLVFLLSEMVMFDIHKSNGPLSSVVKKYSLMFFEISENRAEHNNLYEAMSKNIQLAGLTHVFGLSLALTYLIVDVVSHVLIYPYTTSLGIFTKIKYSFENITRIQEYLKDPGKFTMITLAPVPATFHDPYGIQTWCKPLETTATEEKEKDPTCANATNTNCFGGIYPTINSDLNSRLHQFEKQKEGSMLEVSLDKEALEKFFWVVNTDKEEHNNTMVSVQQYSNLEDKVVFLYKSDIPRAVWNPPLTQRGSPQPKCAARVGVSESDMPQDI
ncbi:hypothetical protein CQW23_09192 [Capsicum baccatum]|uniref:Uncharacterized protein n=1 Tax=Capsicum baccatum TaxID=33114 RepID=A0A2G2WW37_CAPBA|nr:hypothetical protein CQW23_09192 [Capsicum baccatum]